MSNDQVIQFRGTIYGEGYGMIAKKVMRDKDLSPTAKSIYAYICSFAGAGKDGKVSAFPGVKIMMSELGIKTDKTYYTHRKYLLEKGYITIEKNRQKGKFENNIYFIEPVPVAKENKDSENDKTPYGKNYSKENLPHGNLSSMNKSSLIKEGTIINSSINTRKDEEEENYISENAFHRKVGNFLLGKNVNQKTVNQIIINLERNNVEIVSLKIVMQQYDHIMKTMQHTRIFDFAKYFVNGLVKLIEQEGQANKYNQETQEKAANVPDVYFNWINEQ